MGTGTSREALMGVIQETDERAQVSIGLLSYMNHLTCPIWALNLTTMRMRQQSKFDLTMELVKLVENHLHGRPVYFVHLKSGSTSEGMCLPTVCTMQGNQVVHLESADIDNLAVDTSVLVAGSPAEARALGTNLVLDTSHTQDAFAQVRVLFYSGHITPYVCQARVHNGKKVVYLSRAIHTELFGRMREERGQTTHGPAVTDEFLGTVGSRNVESQARFEGSMDEVYCIPCSGWPDGMLSWARRPRHQGWPTKDTIDTVLQMPCYLVPVAHKLSTDPEIEWRISFSAAELIIADTFTMTKRQVYLLLKYLVKQAISGLGTGMCTYHLKTTFSWANETVSSECWLPHRMGAAFLAVLDVLETFLQQHHIPNYFFPKSNLIAHLTQDQLSLALTAVRRIRNQPLSALLDTQDRVRFEGQPLLQSFKCLFGPSILAANEAILAGRCVSSSDVVGCAMAHASAFLPQRPVSSALSTMDWHRELVRILLNTDFSESQLWFHMYHLVLHRCRDLDLAIEYTDCAIVQCEALIPVTGPDPDGEDWLWIPDTGPHNYGGEVSCVPLSHHRTIHEVISMLKALLGQLYHVKMHQSVGNARQICEVRTKALLEEAKKLYPSVMCDSEFTVFFRRRNMLFSRATLLARSKAFLASEVPTNKAEHKDTSPNPTSSNLISHVSLSADCNSVSQDNLLEMLEKTIYWIEMIPMLGQMSDEVSRTRKFGAHWKLFIPLEANILEAPLSSIVLEMESDSHVMVPYEIYLVYSVAVRIQGITVCEDSPFEAGVQEVHGRVHKMAADLLGVFSDLLAKQYEFMPAYIKAGDAELCLSTVLLMRAILAWHDGFYGDAKELWQRAHALKPDIDTLRMCLHLQDGDDLEEFFQQPEDRKCKDDGIKQATTENMSTCDTDQGEARISDLISSNDEGISVTGKAVEMQTANGASDATAVTCSVSSSHNEEVPNKSAVRCDNRAAAESSNYGISRSVNTVETDCLENDRTVLCQSPSSTNENSDPRFHSEASETTPLLQPSDVRFVPTPCSAGNPLTTTPQSATVDRSKRQRSVKSKVCICLVWILAFPLIVLLLLCYVILKGLVKAAPYIASCLYNMKRGTERVKGSLFGRYHIIPPDEVEDLQWIITGTYRPNKPEDAIPTIKTIDNFAAILQARGINTTGIWPVDQPRFFAALEQARAETPKDPVAHLDDILDPGPEVTFELAGAQATVDSHRQAIIKDGQKYPNYKLPNKINLENAIKYEKNRKSFEKAFGVSNIRSQNQGS